MSDTVEHDNAREGQAAGPDRTGVYGTVAEAKAAGGRLASLQESRGVVYQAEASGLGLDVTRGDS